MDLLARIKEIDEETGDVDACLQILKQHKNSCRDLYKQFKKYWVLVYIAEIKINSYDEFLIMPEQERFNIFLQKAPDYLSLFDKKYLENCLDFEDSELAKIFPHLWKILPKTQLITRILSAKNPEEFFNLPIQIDTLPDLTNLSELSYKILLKLSSPKLLPSIIANYFPSTVKTFLEAYKSDLLIHGSYEKSATLENFRILKFLMADDKNFNISKCSLNLIENILSEYLAPPFISQDLLPYEISEILDDLNENDLKKIKEFVFNKMLAANISNSMGKILLSKGVKCEKDLELNEYKLNWVDEMPEELALEFINCKDVREAQKVVAKWRESKEM
ncbi:hypothetical protein SteCoe_21411 [Stentor coeruleus]|uniref:Uncharacterized protein n=1 Tax=Stentor coeruleus TaxID=5963 RepID=A0A1R2BPK5_9CILI|nr:hypothetical protein SteCoe_21411 [Stentor coeruleus]